ncbi:MAG: malate dehydrogenase [Nitrospirae bacterium]|nr:malate dehydrogenase [Nitrospirota bacterium]
MNKKITIVGAGNVGASVAQRILEKGLGDVILVDVVEGIPQGKALDLQQSTPLYGYDCRVIGTNDYKDTTDSDIAIITAGLPRKPGMSRDELLKANAEIVKMVTREVASKSTQALIIVVTNPLDLMTYVASEISGFPKKRVFGMGGVLDSARFISFIAEEFNVSIEKIHTIVIGNHGDLMVPLPRYTTVAGTPITELIPKEKIERLVERTRKAGAEIVGFLKTGSAYYAPAAATVEMVDAILNNRKKTLPCSTYLNGEYGIKGIYAGVPVVLGTAGVEKVVELDLTEEEKKSFLTSIEAVREGVKLLKGLL